MSWRNRVCVTTRPSGNAFTPPCHRANASESFPVAMFRQRFAFDHFTPQEGGWCALPPWLRCAARWRLAFVWCSVVFGWLGPSAAAANLQPDELHTAAAVLSLPAVEAAKHLPVSVECLILLLDRHKGAVVVQDGTGSMFVELDTIVSNHIARGDRVRLTGVTDAGLFAPMVVHPRFSFIEHGVIPPAPFTPFADLMRPDLDGQWVEVSGVVRAVATRANAPQDCVIDLASSELRVSVVLNSVQEDEARKWIDRKVKFRAVCFHLYNDARQLFGVRLAVPAEEKIEAIYTPATPPYELPVRMPRDLLTYNRTGPEEHRVHLRGQVTYAVPGVNLFLQNGREAIEVKTKQAGSLRPGMTVDVVGFVGRGSRSATIEDAEFRVVNAVGEVSPVRVTPVDACRSDNVLISTEATLVSLLRESTRMTFVFGIGKENFVATLPWNSEAPAPADWEPGAKFRLTGICVAPLVPYPGNEFSWHPRGFQLLLRSASDLSILSRAPWWNAYHLLRLTILGLVVVVIALAALFIRYRMRAIEQRQYRFAAEREFTAVLSERNRMAREIHDTLAQGMTSISAQLEIAKEAVAVAPERTLAALALARESVRSSLADARRSVWALRPQVLETRDLRSALAAVGHELSAGTGVSVTVKQIGSEERLPPEMDAELLRIGQEAMTNAIRHGRPTFVRTEIHIDPQGVKLRVLDDGCGLAKGVAECREGGAGFGLTGIRERAAHFGGKFEIFSPPGGGTELCVVIPVAS